MKKAILISFMVGIAVMLGSSAMAQNLPAPANLTCSLVDTDGDGANDAVHFDWDGVTDADKYSVDVEVPVDTTDNGVADMIVELSFGTSDRTDGGLMEDSDLDVPLSEFVYIDDDGNVVQLSGMATAKVKALAPGKGKGRQNNPFSTECTVTLP